MNVVSKEQIEKYEYLNEKYFEPPHTQAKQYRDSRARDLRKEGWTVKVTTCHFDTKTGYFLEAKRGRTI